jgi:hypothetical protein
MNFKNLATIKNLNTIINFTTINNPNQNLNYFIKYYPIILKYYPIPTQQLIMLTIK